MAKMNSCGGVFTGKTLMITGGTGSFGNTVLKHFMNTDLAEIRIFSRDEKKQDDMRHRLQEKSPELASKVRFFIGDVRNAQSVRDAMHGVDYIFHAAALKQVPSCEFFPMEAVRTNVIGTDNVLHAAIEEGVDRVVCLSTDKAAYPINAMGKSKAMMESIIYANARNGAGRTTICCTRYGNVMCSRGSVIPLFIDRIRKGEPLTVTDPNMTRFLMNLDEAVDLVQFAFEHANPGDLFIQKAPAGLATLMWTIPGGAQETGGPYMRDPRHPRHFTDEFKRQIVDLYNAGKPKREIMDEYDLGKSTVERWIKSINATGSPRAADNRTPEQNRILELERENRRLRMEVDVLKQAALIYARK